PRAKGRFGAGLMTLGRLGTKLAVHSQPYHFVIEANTVRPTTAIGAIQGFFDPKSTDTLLVLDLAEGFDAADFQEWFEGLGAEALMFLDTVRALRLYELPGRRALVEHRLTHTKPERKALLGLDFEASRSTVRDPKTGRTWERFDADWPMPPGIKRRY